MHAAVTVEIQVSAGGFVKRGTDGDVDFIAPLPCPFNYGELPGTIGGDGDPIDAVVLGPRARRGAMVTTQVRGAVAFLDAGAADLKLVCGAQPLTKVQRALVLGWFGGYGVAKSALNRARGKTGATRAAGWLDAATARAQVAAARQRYAAHQAEQADESEETR